MPATLPAPPSAPPPGEAGLNPMERELVDIFVGVAQRLGLPKSLGEIYGLAFASPEPISLGDACTRLLLSKGAASMGIRTLVGLGALRSVYTPGDRRDRFQPETSLKAILQRLAGEKLLPHLNHGRERLRRLDQLAAATSVSPILRSRLATLKGWHGKADKMLPVLLRLIG